MDYAFAVSSNRTFVGRFDGTLDGILDGMFDGMLDGVFEVFKTIWVNYGVRSAKDRCMPPGSGKTTAALSWHHLSVLKLLVSGKTTVQCLGTAAVL